MRTAAALVVGALVLAACNGTDDVEPPEDTITPQPEANAAEPDPQGLDDQTATQLYVSWRETVHALPPTEPEAVDSAAAGEAVVVPDSEAADWIRQELELARDRGVVVRGDIHAEPTSPVHMADEEATVTMCSSADVRPTDVATGEPVGDEAIDTSYTRFDVAYRRIGDAWLIERAEANDERDCVPPSIEEAVEARWAQYVEAWIDLERRGGGADIGPLATVVTDRFAEMLRSLPPHEPVTDPPPFTDFRLTAADRSTVAGHACRAGHRQTVEWELVGDQWRIDFVGQVGEEEVLCP